MWLIFCCVYVKNDKKLLKNEKTPWKNSKVWKDQKAFNAYLRSLVRRGWNKARVKFDKKNAGTYKKKVGMYKNGKPKVINYCKCEMCKKEFPASKIEVDHIIPAGAFYSREEFKEWVANLFYIGVDDLALLCHTCHSRKTYSEIRGISIDQATKEEPLRKFLAKKAGEQKKILIKMGCQNKDMSNAVKREQLFKKHNK